MEHASMPRRIVIKDAAKAKFQAAGLSQQHLAEAKLNAARGEYEEREKQYFGGQGTLDIFMGASQRLLEAAYACATSDRDRMSILERYWQRCCLLDRINRMRVEAGRVPYKHYRETTYMRLGAEKRLAHRRTNSSTNLPVGGTRLNRTIAAKEYARGKFDAWHADPTLLPQGMVSAAYDALLSRSRQFFAGQGTLDLLIGASQRCLDADLPLSDKPTSRLTAHERHWELMRLVEEINRLRYDARRIAIQYLLQSTYARADAQLRWLRAREVLPGAIAPGGPSWMAIEMRVQQGWPTPLIALTEVKWLAQEKRHAVHANMSSLMWTKVEAGSHEYVEREKALLDGQGTLDILLETSRNLLAADLEASSSKADRLAALEAYWRRSCLIEAANRRRYEAAQIPVQDFLEAVYFQIDAHLRCVDERMPRK
jgi:hypothetical protein